MTETICELALKSHIKNKIEMSVRNQKTILKYIKKQDEEIERLNNIINELERYIEKGMNSSNYIDGYEAVIYEEFYDKLEELKEK